MKNGVHAALLSLVCTVFMGCFSGNPPIQPLQPLGEHRARLFIYRPWGFSSALVAPMVYINEEKILLLKNGGYTVVTLESGGLILSTKRNSTWDSGEEHAVWLILHPGRTYYVRMQTATGFRTSSFLPQLVPEAVAVPELKRTHKMDAEKEVYTGRGNIRHP